MQVKRGREENMEREEEGRGRGVSKINVAVEKMERKRNCGMVTKEKGENGQEGRMGRARSGPYVAFFHFPFRKEIYLGGREREYLTLTVIKMGLKQRRWRWGRKMTTVG